MNKRFAELDLCAFILLRAVLKHRKTVQNITVIQNNIHMAAASQVLLYYLQRSL